MKSESVELADGSAGNTPLEHCRIVWTEATTGLQMYVSFFRSFFYVKGACQRDERSIQLKKENPATASSCKAKETMPAKRNKKESDEI